MKDVLLFTLFLFIFQAASAQRNLSGSIHQSPYTYIYKIDTKEAGLLTKDAAGQAKDIYLHSLVDSFTTGDAEPRMPDGNYLFVYANDNRLSYELHTFGDLRAKLINNDHDLSVFVHNKAGTAIDNASVYLDRKQLFYNSTTMAYGPVKRRKASLVKVVHKNILYSFPVYPNLSPQQPLLQKIAGTFPLKNLLQLFRKKQSYNNYFSGPTAYEKRFKSFLVFSKPRYKPGDTVRLKAFAETAKGHPVNRALMLRISNRYLDKDTILSTIKPFGAGGYEYWFVLSDSLDLDLDEEYLITLEEQGSIKTNVANLKDDIDEKHALKRSVVARGRFTYEDYELNSITFSARSNKTQHSRNEELALFFKAVDENELAAMDGRVEVLIQPEDYGDKEFHAPKVFLRDTLWFFSRALESLGETKIVVPDSIFPKATFKYRIQCTFLNTNNEVRTQTLYEEFKDETETITISEHNDSLKIDHFLLNKSIPVQGTLYVSGTERDTLAQLSISLPATIKINPYAKRYSVIAAGLHQTYELQQTSAMVSCTTMRTNDSIYVQLINPMHLPVWYTVFAGNRPVFRGYGDTLVYRSKTQTAKNYFVSIRYVYGNIVRSQRYTVPFREKLLSIAVNQPEFVFPGQTVPIQISVTDAAGKAVSNADVTAYAFTKKFHAPVPYVPYLGKTYRMPKRFPQLNLQETTEKEFSSRLNWARWGHEMKLDTIEYYKFLHPGTIYINSEPAPDSITQLAPFVVSKGDLVPIHLLYIDEKPVFFSQAKQMQRYSFRVAEGRHSIRFRTADKSIQVDSVWVPRGMKSFISIEADTANKSIHIEKRPDTLTAYEKQLWSKYMILVENNFGENLSYINQGDNYYLINGLDRGYRPAILTGPLTQSRATMVTRNKFEQEFVAEGGWQYNISKGLIKQKQLLRPNLFNPWLRSTSPLYNFHDFVLTEPEIDSMWQEFLDNRSHNTPVFFNNHTGKMSNGRLQVGLEKNEENDRLFIKNIILFRYDNPDFIQVYPGSSRDLGYVQQGKYRLLFLLKKDNYFICDSIVVLPNGINYYEAGIITETPKDSISSKIAAIIESRDRSNTAARTIEDLNRIKETFHEKYLDMSAFTETITGSVVDSKGTPVPGVSIIVKGTRSGTVSDANGQFTLAVPANGVIVVSAVAYDTREFKINPEASYRIVLTPAKNLLQEVVVTGYGISKRSNLTGSITNVSSDFSSGLSGKIPGLQIRGANSVNATPLIIVDGLPFSGRLEDLPQDELGNITVLKDAAATAIYGERAAAGVIIVTTKKSALLTDSEPPIPGNSLRSNFRDNAYWQPRLMTDAMGKVTFNATFPDDITNWSTYVIAMGKRKLTGFSEGSIKSFKAISGNIALPQFAISGDTMLVIGKTLNYLADSIKAKRSFAVNNNVVKESMINLRNSWIDTFSVNASGTDSLKLRYTVEKENGYFDGEERSIPIFKQGVPENNGFFAALNNDTSFTLPMNADTGVLKLYAEVSLLPVLHEETENIRRYEYLCNEQLASKLKAMLVQKRIDQYLKQPFKGDKNIRELIGKLNQTKSASGLWGWWAGNDPSVWISLHITEALLKAQQSGYAVAINKSMLTDYLIYNLGQYKGTEKLLCLDLLYQLGAKADFKQYIDSIENQRADYSLYERLRITELKQKVNIPFVLDTLISKQSHTALGNVYWGEDNHRFFDNAIQNTLCMYRILKSAGGYDDLLLKIRNYFLEKRNMGHWRNTYESSLILEAILPDVLSSAYAANPTTLTINGKETITVQAFPFYREVQKGDKLSLTKHGNMPVYFTAYEQHWNTAPLKINGNFSVQSTFRQQEKKVSKLKAGSPVILRVDVSVKADANYVLIEIPIPAGCSYQDKAQPKWNNEVHREYFKNKVSIFCTSLTKGEYNFTVSLLPRYSGSYTLNPATAEMMYFPVFNGREAIRKVAID